MAHTLHFSGAAGAGTGRSGQRHSRAHSHTATRSPCVLWAVYRYHACPAQAAMRTIAMGGDTDTAAAMVGAILGALHGDGWIPREWLEGPENGARARGRDYAVDLVHQLADLDLEEHAPRGGRSAATVANAGVRG